MIGKTRGKRLDTCEGNYVVFDLETTGVSWKHDKIIEISAVKVKDGEVAEEFTSLVNPGCHISEGATAVNGITDDMVEGEPSISEVLPRFLEFIGDEILVGHNIGSFDMNFIYRDAEEICNGVPGNDYVDTLYLSRSMRPDLSSHKLTSMAETYGIATEGAHRALADCHMNQKVFEHLKQDTARRAAEAANAPKCPKCGRRLKKRNGMYGAFYGCSGFPMCNYTQNIDA